MCGQLPYDYRELAYDLYHAEDQLLEELVSLRAHRGMTQKQLADEMGVSQSYVSQIENGRKKAYDIAHRLCAGSRSAHYI